MTERDHVLALDPLLQDAEDPVYLMDPRSDRIVDANRAGCELLGYTLDELRATSVSRIHPAELAELRALVDEAVEHGETWTIGLTCRTKSGRFLPTEITLLALRTEAQVYLVGLVRDRSEHRGS